MTLKCKCGGTLEEIEIHSGYEDNTKEGWAMEKYKCSNCEKTGILHVSFGPWGESKQKRGCIA